MKEKLIYFELNNWFSGRDYPNEEPFATWMQENRFDNEAWCKQNRLVVTSGFIDMSRNWCIIATESWVQENCPKLLEDHTCTYNIITHTYDTERNEPIDKTTVRTTKMSDFLRHPDEDGVVYGRFDWRFPEYSEENFGVLTQEEEES